MKRLGLTAAVMLGTAMAVRGDTTNVTMSVGEAIPDNDLNGLAVSTNLSGLSGSISEVTVGLNLAGGYNGDLYAYLAGPNGGFAVLLNRTGVGGGNGNGYGDGGFNITLDDSGGNPNIHYYENVLNPNGGILTGTWGSDGENVDPVSGPVGSAPATATLGSFDGTDPNGTWVLFLADVSAGGISTLNDWTLTIDTAAVPEPSAWALGGLGMLALSAMRMFSRRR